jgi:2-hydroxy-6-oxonona-2,4-dienedioate hydrolase
MFEIREENVQIAGLQARLLRGGDKSAPAVVFVHGGLPGVTPYCSGAHCWGDVLQKFAKERHVIALDMPGSAGTAMTGQPLSVDVLGQFIVAALDVLGIESCDLVVHESSGIVGLWRLLHGRRRSWRFGKASAQQNTVFGRRCGATE